MCNVYRNKARLILAVAGLQALGACSANSGNGPPKDSAPPGDTFDVAALDACNALTSKVNAILGACSGIPAGEQDGYYGNNCQQLALAVTNNRVTFDPSKVSQCMSDLGSLLCANPGNSIVVPQPPAWESVPSCAQVFVGTSPDGSYCSSALECKTPNSICYGCLAGTFGVCNPPVGNGGNCDESNCQAGLSCELSNTTCNPTSGPNAACLNSPCQAGYFCDIGGTDTCKAQLTSGACDPNVDACAPGYTCPGTGPNAQTCIKMKSPGDSCTPGAYECATGVFCDPTTSKCTAWSNVGGPCGGMLGQESGGCLGGWCEPTADAGPYSAGTCRAPQGPGASCPVFTTECVAGYACKIVSSGSTCITTSCY
jgi:hypothetical protein